MNKQKKQQAIVLLAVVSAYFAFSDLYTFFSDKVPALEAKRITVEKQMQERRQELMKLRDFAKNIELVKQELRELDIQLETALEALPRTANFAELLRRLDLLAQNSGVELIEFKPNLMANHASNSKTFYITHQIEFSISGSFTSSLVFFDQLSRLKRLVNLQKIGFARVNTTARDMASYDTPLKITGTIKTYQFTQ